MALICQTIVADSLAELRKRRDAVCDADMVELRLDGIADVDVAGALEGRTRPAVVTCRTIRDGGRFDGAEDDRLRMLGDAVRLGAEFVDVEFGVDRASMPRGDRTRLILSRHAFGGIPQGLGDLARAMRRDAPEAIVKIAVTVNSLDDVLNLRRETDVGDRVIIGMGAPGFVTRVCPWLFGSLWTFAGSAAPGQISSSTLRNLFRTHAGSSSTRLFAITGAPLSHSASPAMHNAAFGALAIDAIYVPLESRDYVEFLKVAEGLEVEGASVTAPLKTGWQEHGVDLDERARTIGAANTLKRVGTKWVGRNFDVDGFEAPLDARGTNLRGARCVIVGAGGAARAAATALRARGATVEISARRAESAARLSRELAVESTSFPPTAGWDLLVNATPVGTWPDTSAPIPRELVRGRLVYDLVYHPRRTTLLNWAGEAGAEVIDGLEMLVHQAQRQFEFWTGRVAPGEVMMRAAEEFLETEKQPS